MVNIARLWKRITYLTAATVVSLGSMLALVPQGASAAQVTSRSVQLSTSSNAGSAATTSYNVNFTVATSSANLRGIVLDFCSNSPIIGDTTCSGTVGTTVPNLGGSPSVTTSGVLTAAGWTAGQLNSNRTLTLTNATGVATTANVSVVSFVIANVQNPTTLGTFYARIYTYTATAGATGYTVANPDSGATRVDDGGIALATANQITVTAKVQESLTFCVYTTGANCAGASVAGIALGDSNGVLAVYNSAYVGATTAKIGVGSNATTGVTVRAKTPATLTSGSNTIAATGSGAGTCTADSTTTSVEQFGFRISTTGSNQTADAGYGCSSGNHSFDTANLASTYGDPILTTAGPQDESASEIEFAAKAATTSEPGIYTATFTYIATGTY